MSKEELKKTINAHRLEAHSQAEHFANAKDGDKEKHHYLGRASMCDILLADLERLYPTCTSPKFKGFYIYNPD